MKKLMMMAAAVAALATAANAAPKHAAHHAHATAVHPAAPKTPLYQLIDIARTNDARLERDKFAEPVAFPNTDGQAVHLELPFDTESLPPHNTTASYDDGNLTLQLNVEAAPGSFDDTAKSRTLPMMIGIRSATGSGAGYVGENAFGVKKHVDVIYSRADGIALVNVKATGLIVSTPFAMTINGLTGPQAKTLIAHTRVVIDGVLAPIWPGIPAHCGSTYSGATIDDPVEMSGEACYAGVAIGRIAFVDTSTGKVMKEWTYNAEGQQTNAVNVQAKLTRIPDPDEIARYYPERAERTGVTGSATVLCSVDTRGTLSICDLVSETPTGEGFGQAALMVANFARATPATIDGTPTDGSVRLKVDFGPEGTASAVAVVQADSSSAPGSNR